MSTIQTSDKVLRKLLNLTHSVSTRSDQPQSEISLQTIEFYKRRKIENALSE